MNTFKCFPVFFFAMFITLAANSQTTYGVVEELDVKVTMRDGIRLSTNIYRPHTTGTFPVVLVRTPYGNGGEGNRDGHFFARHGFVYVAQDVRGQSQSEGCFYAMRSELKDGIDMLQWTGSQPWSNGKVGTLGGSYVGFTQWMPAAAQSPYLKTMMPAVSFSDLYNTVYQNGALFLGLFGPWSIEMTKPHFVKDEWIRSRMDSVLLSLPLMEMDKAMGWRIPFLRDCLAHPTRDKFWDETSIGDNYHKITASVYNVGGWFDILLKGTIDNYLKMTGDRIAPETRKKQKLVIGPWVHSWGQRKVGELDFGEEASFNDQEFRLNWFNSQLKGINNGIMEEPPVKIFVMGDNRWRAENEWPLARTNYRKYYLHSKGKANTLNGDGSLNVERPKDEPRDSFIYDPAHPVISKETMGPYDQRAIENRQDVLVYTTPVLKSDMEVTGPVKVILFASSSASNTDFTAKLVDVHPDGRAMRICEGIIRASHRNADKRPSNIVPGEVYEYEIDLWATSNLFKKGHQIRVEIASSNFPRFDRNLNTGNDFATETNMIKAKQEIFHSKKYPSCIILPVIEE